MIKQASPFLKLPPQEHLLQNSEVLDKKLPLKAVYYLEVYTIFNGGFMQLRQWKG